jgi:hypothetical protein
MTANVSFDGATPVVVTFPATGGYGQIQTVSVTGVFQQGSTNTLKISPVAPATTAPDMDGISAPVL